MHYFADVIFLKIILNFHKQLCIAQGHIQPRPSVTRKDLSTKDKKNDTQNSFKEFKK